ncbi:ribosome small subunit-dependent GTPase A [Lacticaseibacillus daqingensis]|uniref:ribosome small subunit-dependent GTPase A n=1 Tax=Lacticaseibacillus daqingensis TaxID=2486014 RepID=UPI000F772162|nr:ribosome small subunit-dependent GTPase A [Lacticaseibacillus daqingensis]
MVNTISKAEQFRVASIDSKTVNLLDENGRRLSLALAKQLTKTLGRLVVGDIVLVADGQVTQRQPRQNELSKQRGTTSKSFHQKGKDQLVAANIDFVLITIAADQRFTLSMVDRYVASFSIPNARLAILVTKADAPESQRIYDQIRAAHPELQVLRTSIYDQHLRTRFGRAFPGQNTFTLLGASGTGKSTLINYLAQTDLQTTNQTRTGDNRGKHTTTASALLPIAPFGYLIDTPGFKVIKSADFDPDVAFPAIIELAKQCQFSDCRHLSEPGCAVRQAVDAGALDPAVLLRYQNLMREAQLDQRRHR